MLKKLSVLLLASFVGYQVYAAVASGPAGSFIRNQNTLQGGTTFYVSSGTVTNLQTTTLKFNDGTTMTTAASGSGGGGGASSLGVFKNGVQVSSPTNQINFSGSYWGVTLGGASTGTITLQEGNTSYMQVRNTLQSGTTVYPSFLYVGSSQSITGSNGLSVTYGVSVGSLAVTGLSTNKMVATDSNSRFWSKGSISLSTEVAGIIPSANLPPSTTVYILNSNSLTTGTTAYVDFLRSRTVAVFQSTAIALNGTYNGTVSGASFATFPNKGTTIIKSKTAMANLDSYPGIEFINPANLSVWNDANNDSLKYIAEFGFEYDDGFTISNNPVLTISTIAVVVGSGMPITASSATITNLNTTTLKFNDGTTMTTASVGGGGGSSSLGVFQNGTQVSSPTAQINFIGPPFSVSVGGSSTATVTLNGSSVTLQGNTFNAANKLVQLSGSNLITNSLIDGSSITKQGLLVAGSNITLTPGAGTLTIASSGGGGGGSGTTIAVQVGGVNYDTSVSTVNFSSGSFTATSSPAGRANIEISTNITNQTYNFFIPDDGNWDGEAFPLFESPVGSTITIVQVNATSYGVGGSSITFQLNERRFGTISTSGSNIFSTDKTANNDGSRYTTFSDADIAPESFIVFVTTTNARSGVILGLKGSITYRRIP